VIYMGSPDVNDGCSQAAQFLLILLMELSDRLLHSG